MSRKKGNQQKSSNEKHTLEIIIFVTAVINLICSVISLIKDLLN
jgi:hypothetical protein